MPTKLPLQYKIKLFCCHCRISSDQEHSLLTAYMGGLTSYGSTENKNKLKQLIQLTGLPRKSITVIVLKCKLLYMYLELSCYCIFVVSEAA